MSNPTPGPWSLTLGDEYQHAEVWTAEANIATVCDGANARLIAAAPDMYEAIREFCAAVDGGHLPKHSAYTAAYKSFAAVIERVMGAQASGGER